MAQHNNSILQTGKPRPEKERPQKQSPLPSDAAKRRVEFSRRCSTRQRGRVEVLWRPEGRLRECPQAHRAPIPPTRCQRHAPRFLSFAHPPALPGQDFPHISEFPSGSGSRSPGPSNPPSSSGDWDSSYPSAECGVSTCRWVLTPGRAAAPAAGGREGPLRVPMGTRSLHEKTQNEAETPEGQRWSDARAVPDTGPAAVFLPTSGLIVSWVQPCDTHRWRICPQSGSLEAEPDLGALMVSRESLQEKGREGAGQVPGRS